MPISRSLRATGGPRGRFFWPTWDIGTVLLAHGDGSFGQRGTSGRFLCPTLALDFCSPTNGRSRRITPFLSMLPLPGVFRHYGNNEPAAFISI